MSKTGNYNANLCQNPLYIYSPSFLPYFMFSWLDLLFTLTSAPNCYSKSKNLIKTYTAPNGRACYSGFPGHPLIFLLQMLNSFYWLQKKSTSESELSKLTRNRLERITTSEDGEKSQNLIDSGSFFGRISYTKQFIHFCTIKPLTGESVTALRKSHSCFGHKFLLLWSFWFNEHRLITQRIHTRSAEFIVTGFQNAVHEAWKKAHSECIESELDY